MNTIEKIILDGELAGVIHEIVSHFPWEDAAEDVYATITEIDHCSDFRFHRDDVTGEQYISCAAWDRNGNLIATICY